MTPDGADPFLAADIAVQQLQMFHKMLPLLAHSTRSWAHVVEGISRYDHGVELFRTLAALFGDPKTDPKMTPKWPKFGSRVLDRRVCRAHDECVRARACMVSECYTL